jgi:hypothetical protein
MTGSEYSSNDPELMWRAIKARDDDPWRKLADMRARYPVEIRLRLNNPEPSYLSLEYPGGGEYVLEIRGEDAVLNELEQALFASELDVRRLK